MVAFTPSRPDGRSDRQVVFDLTRGSAPDTTFTYQQLTDALGAGLEFPVERDRVYRAVAQANKTLLREEKRYLSVVKGVGYRVINSGEHLPVALIKKDRAQTYLKKGIELLRNARIDELDATQRTLHEGQLLILGGLYRATQESARRHDKAEALIDQLTSRVEKLESGS